MKIKEAIKRDKKRIEKSKKSRIRELKTKKLKNYKVILTEKKTYTVRGLLFERNVPSIVDGQLARYLRITGYFKIEGVE